MKKLLIILAIFIVSPEVFSFPKIENLLDIALDNNIDIRIADNNLKSSEISKKTLNASYVPSITFSNQEVFEVGKSIIDIPLKNDAYINIVQPIPGGASISITGDYYFNTAEIQKEMYICQELKTSFSLTQSLFPFWLQGMIKDPIKLNAALQTEYYFFMKEYTKKQVFQDIIQNYAYALIYKNKIISYKNNIDFIEKQIEALRQLQITGGTNISKITELESNKWTFEQDVINYKINYESYLQTIKNLCGIDIEFGDEIVELSNINEMLKFYLPNSDPLDEQYKLKIRILENENTLKKQNSAPTINISVMPQWTFDMQRVDKWKDAWDLNSPKTWSTSISFDFSPLLSSVARRMSEQNKIEIVKLLDSYEAYKKQREFVRSQYEELVKSFENQMENVVFVYNKSILEETDSRVQLENGIISLLDYERIFLQMKNYELSKNSIEIYLWLYKILLSFL